jgi:sporulation protein YlmC with PRC-barrel domain
MSIRLTELERMRVVSADGSDLGRLMDLRLRSGPGPVRVGALADALLIGAAGWFERLGFRSHHAREVKPKDVLAVQPDAIVVREPPVDSKRRR